MVDLPTAKVHCPRCQSADVRDNREDSDYACNRCGAWFDVPKPDGEPGGS